MLDVLRSAFWGQGWRWRWLLTIWGKEFVIPEVFFGGIVVPATGGTVADSYIIGHVLSGFIIDVPCELVRCLAGRTGVAAVFALVFFKVISKL